MVSEAGPSMGSGVVLVGNNWYRSGIGLTTLRGNTTTSLGILDALKRRSRLGIRWKMIS
ncbi:hypothetical protein IC582_002155 [Cucumis melo]